MSYEKGQPQENEHDVSRYVHAKEECGRCVVDRGSKAGRNDLRQQQAPK